MKKKKKHDLHQLVSRLVDQIEIQKNTVISEAGRQLLIDKWRGKEELLYHAVLKTEQLLHKKVSQLEKETFDKVEFQIGVSLSGEPIVVTHLVKEHKTYIRHNKAPKVEVQTKGFMSRTIF